MSTYIITTIAQREFKALERLEPLCADVFVPAEWRKVKRVPHRQGRLDLPYARAQPLWSRYVVVTFDGHPPWMALRRLAFPDGQRVVTSVCCMDGRPRSIALSPVQRLMLRSIRPLIERTIPVDKGFAPGERVRVLEGPFKGFVMTVRGKANRTHYRALGKLFSSLIEIDVPQEHLEGVAA